MPYRLYCVKHRINLDELTSRAHKCKQCRHYRTPLHLSKLSRSCVWCVHSRVEECESKKRVRRCGGEVKCTGL